MNAFSLGVVDDDSPAEIPKDALFRELLIVNKKGLHARASAKFVQTVERFEATVTVRRGGEVVGGRSIMGLLTLGAAKGTKIVVTAQGSEAEASLAAIAALIENRFGEED